MFRIKELRKCKGISMKEAARLLDMPYTTYVNYEKGLREPSSEVLIQLADFYDTSVDYIVGRSAVNTRAHLNTPPLPSNIVRIAARDGSFVERELTDQQLAALQAILDQMPDVPDGL